ncbi:hypothetical protein A5886_001476 [Enterococcus sp. 8G7_MSG3316]|uniref:Uncharacterized protein n=1 Tax=Candidatus Enterococcus testudinis TaxID=1834191 RepID=A0A242A657_9ENTE|nr:hypothetical protein [Enterococcus sp. 8G7_MSG3316]OTN76399.1 hypothetical protein A5886_001476 [Enterococcus sp. 8G7_MSG3316]
MKDNDRLIYLKDGVESFVKAIKEHNLEEVIHMGYVSFAESASDLEGNPGYKSLPIASVHDNDIVSELGKTTASGGTNTQ